MSIILVLAGLAFYLSSRKPARVKPNDPAVDELAPLVEAYKLIKRKAYESLPPERAVRGGIAGMAEEVDEFSQYVPPGKVAPFGRRVSGTLEETGLRIIADRGRLLVAGPLPNSPAHKAGLFAELELLAVDDVPAEDLTLEEARRAVTHPADGTVSLRLRDRHGKCIEQTLECARFDAETVTGLVRDDAGAWSCTLDETGRIHYLRISEFVEATPSELQNLYQDLRSPGGLVLDLRDNPGGMLPAAAEVADRFLAKGLIVSVVTRDQPSQARYAHAEGTYPEVPLVVLINAGTASAAEIVAGALQVHRRALLLGQPSYGKWRLQTLLPLGHELGQLYLTTAECFPPRPEPTTEPADMDSRPSPETVPARGARPGLRPDVEVEIPPTALRRLERLRLQAMVAPPPRYPGASTVPIQPARHKALKRSILQLDGQLALALRLLRHRRIPTTLPASGLKEKLALP